MLRLWRNAPFVVVWSIPALAFAAGEEHGPPPSLFAGDLGNAIWTLIIFIGLVLVLGKYAWPPILAALQKREQFIHDSLASARKDREDAEARLREIEARLSQSRDEATAIVDEGRRDAEVVRRKAQQDARQEADLIIERARREVGLARDTAVKELYDLTAKLATEAASRIIRKELSPAEHERLIHEAIEEMARTGNGRH